MHLLELIGNTPLVEIQHLNPNPKVRILGKLEGQNPGGSVKDRAAYNMIQSALDRGQIKKGDRLVEATSGNTGIALAMIAKQLGVHMTLIMPAKATIERRQVMKAYGADLILTPADQSIEDSRLLAEKMVAEEGYIMLDQFNNPDNAAMHYKSTGPEIWRDTEGLVTHFVSAMGTTGTIMGTSRYLKEQNPDVQIVGTQPEEGSSIPGIRRWSPDFQPQIFDASRVDQTISVSEEEAQKQAVALAREEGIFSGMSSGGAFYAALQVAQQIEKGLIVFIVCDRGDRYLSSGIFD